MILAHVPKPNLLVSFSGGRTSGFMLYLIWTYWRKKYNVIVVFANTGKEVEGTLLFVKQCADAWGIPIVWVEYWPKSEKGYSCRAEVVTYETASRKGEPFERMIQKLGIPSSGAPVCSRILKRETIKAYVRDVVKWPVSYQTAIGIRNDEDRISKHWVEDRIIYPLIDGGVQRWDNFGNHDKQDVFDFWEAQDFDLDIHADEGNCDNCWKKNFNLLVRNAIRAPQSFDWWREMENKYGNFNPRNNAKPPFNFYRMGYNVDMIFFLADAAPREVLEAMAAQRNRDGCGESCEGFGSIDDDLERLINEENKL